MDETICALWNSLMHILSSLPDGQVDSLSCVIQLVNYTQVQNFVRDYIRTLEIYMCKYTCTHRQINRSTLKHTHIYIYIYIYISSSSSSSCRAVNTDIPDPLSPLLPIVHRLWQVIRVTSRILTELLNVCSSWSSCFFPVICGGP